MPPNRRERQPRKPPPPLDRGALEAIAIVGGEGAIVTGRGGNGGFGGGSSIHSDDTAEAIYDAIADKSVKAIVFRVSSPGGC